MRNLSEEEEKYIAGLKSGKGKKKTGGKKSTLLTDQFVSVLLVGNYKNKRAI